MGWCEERVSLLKECQNCQRTDKVSALHVWLAHYDAPWVCHHTTCLPIDSAHRPGPSIPRQKEGACLERHLWPTLDMHTSCARATCMTQCCKRTHRAVVVPEWPFEVTRHATERTTPQLPIH